MLDFDASTKDRPVAARDKTTGELMWSVPVMDADPSLKASAKAVAVKILSGVEPTIPAPPASMAGLPFVPVVFDGLTVTPYVAANGRMAYSFKATGLRAAPDQGAKSGRGGSKEAA
ncbi:plasmid replication, integration and excision activator [Nonomuraea sp. NPDC049028]|uniref:plasmid replication, integration and excision activator n=1 Tax=Nonomuraea sp. NPDC049028 TaxID=3364348 RepID=UPI00370FC2B1